MTTSVENKDFSLDYLRNPRGYTISTAQEALGEANAKFMQLITPITALAVNSIKDACYSAKSLKCYKHDVKRAFKLLESSLDMFNSNLLFNDTYEFFNPKYLDNEYRSRLSDNITRIDLMRMWQDRGAYATDGFNKEFIVMQYKFEKAYRNHNIPTPDIYAKLTSCETALILQNYMWCNMVKDFAKLYGFTKDGTAKNFVNFRMDKCLNAIKKAIDISTKGINMLDCSDVEKRDIDLGIEQFNKAVVIATGTCHGYEEAIKDNKDKFKNKNTYKKELRICKKNKEHNLQIINNL